MKTVDFRHKKAHHFIDPTYPNHWATYTSMFIIVQVISQTYLAGLIGSTLFFKDRLHAESIWRRLLSIAVALFFFYFAISIGLEAMT
jgi:threonine/homoserine/homoserine lactone efflux protein